MAYTDQQAAAPTQLRIEGDMTIYRAAELKQTFLDALAQRQDIEVDLAAVSEIDTAGLQILMLTKKMALEKQLALRLVAHSAPVLEVFELLNLAPYFGDALVIQASPPRRTA